MEEGKTYPRSTGIAEKLWSTALQPDAFFGAVGPAPYLGRQVLVVSNPLAACNSQTEPNDLGGGR
jgi:hypothetical protein